MADPAVLWPTALGLIFLAAGILSYRREFRLFSLGPIFVAAALAAFAGEHLTAAKSLSALVPKWLPARLFITYFVGVAHLAAAVSLAAKRAIRWSSIFLAIMFGLFVVLLWLPGVLRHPDVRIAWIVTVRETTYAMGGLALFSAVTRFGWLAQIARIWTGFVLVFFGVDHFLHPQFSPGVPDTQPTASWVPQPHAVAYVVGILLIAFGIGMFVRRYASSAGAAAGVLMALLTLVLYVPQFFLAAGVEQQVVAINFVADTLLFSGTMLVIGAAVRQTAAPAT